MIEVYIKKIEPIDEKIENRILNSLSKNARERLNKKRNSALRLASLCVLSLLTDEQRADLDYTESGIPYFKTMDEYISISHSNTYSSLAISDFSVGIDVEDINIKTNSQNLLRFFTENEQKEIENRASTLEIWTKKEALFKYLKNDDINFISLDTTQASVFFKTINLDGAILTVCCEKQTEIKMQKL